MTEITIDRGQFSGLDIYEALRLFEKLTGITDLEIKLSTTPKYHPHKKHGLYPVGTYHQASLAGYTLNVGNAVFDVYGAYAETEQGALEHLLGKILYPEKYLFSNAEDVVLAGGGIEIRIGSSGSLHADHNPHRKPPFRRTPKATFMPTPV